MPPPAGRSIGGGSGLEAVPSLQLNFADLGSGVVSLLAERGGVSATYTRATAAATKLSSGLWKLDVASGSPRSIYGGLSTTAPNPYLQGYMPEGAATQLALNVRDMTNASWTKGATITVAQTGTGIDGGVNACTRVTGGAVAATNTVLQTLAAAATSRTYSCWIQRITGTGPVSVTQDGVSFTDITAQLTTANFVRVELNASQVNASFGVKVDTNGDVIFVDCNQFEAGASATTPIPAAGTRNMDMLTYALTGWYNALAGTLVAAYQLGVSTAQSRCIAEFNDGTGNNEISMHASDTGAGRVFIITGGVGQANIFSGAYVAGSNNKAASSFQLNDISISANAAALGTDVAATIPTVTTLAVGSSVNTNALSSPISNIRYFPFCFSGGPLQLLAAP